MFQFRIISDINEIEKFQKETVPYLLEHYALSDIQSNLEYLKFIKIGETPREDVINEVVAVFGRLSTDLSLKKGTFLEVLKALNIYSHKKLDPVFKELCYICFDPESHYKAKDETKKVFAHTDFGDLSRAKDLNTFDRILQEGLGKYNANKDTELADRLKSFQEAMVFNR